MPSPLLPLFQFKRVVIVSSIVIIDDDKIIITGYNFFAD